jgi:hypothetical protein
MWEPIALPQVQFKKGTTANNHGFKITDTIAETK